MLGHHTPAAEAPTPDPTVRTAARWATLVAVPVTVVAAGVLFATVQERSRAAAPVATPTTPAVVPSAPVVLPAPELSGRAATVCRAVVARLPSAVRGLPQRRVTTGPEQNAAYGEPPLTVACGVEQPTMCATVDDTRPGCVPLATELLIMNRVCWYADTRGATHTFTTMDREIAVQVAVPTGYQQAAQWANEFSDAVAAVDRRKTAGVPSGCA